MTKTIKCKTHDDWVFIVKLDMISYNQEKEEFDEENAIEIDYDEMCVEIYLEEDDDEAFVIVDWEIIYSEAGDSVVMCVDSCISIASQLSDILLEMWVENVDIIYDIVMSRNQSDI